MKKLLLFACILCLNFHLVSAQGDAMGNAEPGVHAEPGRTTIDFNGPGEGKPGHGSGEGGGGNFVGGNFGGNAGSHVGGGNNTGGNVRTPAARGTSTVKVGSGKHTVSQKTLSWLTAILESYYGNSIWSRPFSPANLPNSPKFQVLLDEIYNEQVKALQEHRPADAKYLEGVRKNLLNKTDVPIDLKPEINHSYHATELFDPLYVHNVMVPVSKTIAASGKAPGVKIIFPGYLINFLNQRTSIILRFYNAQTRSKLAASHADRNYKDTKGKVVSISGPFTIPSTYYSTSSAYVLIPYYALNLKPSNPKKKYSFLYDATTTFYGGYNISDIRSKGYTVSFEY